MGKGLNICGQGGVWQVMVMAHQGAGELAQDASGASSLSRWVVGRVEGVGAGVGTADKWIVDAGGSGSGESVGRLVEGAKREWCLLGHRGGWERASEQCVRRPEGDRNGPITPVIVQIGQGRAVKERIG